MNEAFVAFWSTLILICWTSRITLCGKSCDLERKYVVFATPVSQKRRRQPIFVILDSLSAQMNVHNTKFSRKTMKHLNHNASTLRPVQFSIQIWFCYYDQTVLKCSNSKYNNVDFCQIQEFLWRCYSCFSDVAAHCTRCCRCEHIEDEYSTQQNYLFFSITTLHCDYMVTGQ